VAVIVVVAIVVVATLSLVPMESSSSSITKVTSDPCPANQIGPNCGSAFNYTVGDGRYSTLTGQWSATFSDTNSPNTNSVIMTIENSNAGATYMVSGTGGSFSLAGYGPYHMAVVSGNDHGNTTTSISWTLDSTVI
jgi:hypothetical protein